jgi:hypothetical protein
MKISRVLRSSVCAVSVISMLMTGSQASSHREAPSITKVPKVDATDFYLFNSYEAGRTDYVTFVANYLPLQDPYGGPNYFTMDPDALYDIKIDNDGDAVEDVTFRFRFNINRKDIALPIGPADNRRTVAVPVINVGAIGAGDTAALNVEESYSVELIRGNSKRGIKSMRIANTRDGNTTFAKPVDNIGTKSIPDYASYAASHVYDIEIPGCQDGRMFVGQRKDSFVVNLGETFDLVNYSNPLGSTNSERDDLDDANVTSLILEIPKSCLLDSDDQPIIGAWTTASLKRGRFVIGDTPAAKTLTKAGEYLQVSRLSSPLVNELVIGLKDKDRFNSSEPKNDGQFIDYVTHPTLPAILELLFGGAGVKAPTQFPRTDLVAAFVTGLDGLNKNGAVGEMLRLNTSIAAVPAEAQSNLGALAGDIAGFPNGRRPGDDVVDIELRVAMGALLPAEVAPNKSLPFTDGAFVDASYFDNTFPYLKNPLPGSPNDTP